MLHVAAYISGHGFGHATRSAALLAALVARRPAVRLSVVSTAPEWLFRLNLPAPFVYRPAPLDVGTIQRDALQPDIDATLAACLRLLRREPALLAAETEFLRREAVDLVVADIPWVAFPAARRAGVPGVGVSNFTWDWIYADYQGTHQEFGAVVAAIRRGYAEADLLLRLPFHGPCDSFPRRRDIPLVARRPRRPRAAVRAALALDGGRPVVLLSFGGFEIRGLDPTAVARHPDHLFLTTQPVPNPPENLRVVPPGRFPYEELVAAVDTVITKPGYGIVSDCLANRIPVLYTSRGAFAEYPHLVEGLERFGVCQFISNEDLLTGRWGPALAALARRPRRWPELPTNGADVAAEILDGLAGAAATRGDDCGTSAAPGGPETNACPFRR
jgi:L-arabinokinase